MKDVEYLAGREISTVKPMPPYSEEACSFTADLSAALQKSSRCEMYKDIAALAFWCRRANIQRLKTQFGVTKNRLGRGLCFHITPSNIPINFMFSYLFSLLAGNDNIVRLSSRNFPELEPLLDVLSNILKDYPEIALASAFVRYPSEREDITAEFSSIADVRMIWGGDNTITAVKRLPVKPRCIDIAFADRYSVCVINGNSVEDADQVLMRRLAANFYNDTYLMDQNACSSPQLILWFNDSKKARDKFWNSIFDYASIKYSLPAAIAVDKYTHLCKDAIDLIVWIILRVEATFFIVWN